MGVGAEAAYGLARTLLYDPRRVLPSAGTCETRCVLSLMAWSPRNGEPCLPIGPVTHDYMYGVHGDLPR